MLALLALVVLNTALSLRNWWPTPGVLPDHRLAPEFVALWLLLLALVAWRGRLSPRLLTGLSLAYLALVLGRYADVTVPALFGRPVNLYWDGQQIPRFLWVSAREYPGWMSAAAIAVVLALLAALYGLLRWAMGAVARDAAPYALRAKWTWLPTVLALAAVAAHQAGAAPALTWHLVTKPVTPTYARQALLLGTAFMPGRLAAALPVAPVLEAAMAAAPEQALGALRGRDFTLIFLESYGAMAFDNPRVAPQLAPARAQLAADIAASGRLVASAFVRASTFAGASELSHLSLLSGVDLSDPLRHDLLLTSQRPTLTSLFRRAGYQSVGPVPGAQLGLGRARLLRLRPVPRRPRPRLPRPAAGLLEGAGPVQPGALRPAAAGRTRHATALLVLPDHHQPSALRPGAAVPERLGPPAHARPLRRGRNDAAAGGLCRLARHAAQLPVGMFDYTYRWLGGYLQRPEPRESVMLWVGDHQPAASVSGEGASWDVPVHVITRDPELLARFVALGFRPGLEPQRPVLGGMHDLTALLLKAFEAPSAAPTRQAAIAPTRP